MYLVKKNVELIQMKANTYNPDKEVSHIFRGRKYPGFIKAFHSDALEKVSLLLEVSSIWPWTKKKKIKTFFLPCMAALH